MTAKVICNTSKTTTVQPHLLYRDIIRTLIINCCMVLEFGLFCCKSPVVYIMVLTVFYVSVSQEIDPLQCEIRHESQQQY